MKKIIVLSAREFKSQMRSRGWYDYTIGVAGACIVSIGNAMAEDESIGDAANGSNSHWFTGKHDNVLNLDFDDVNPEIKREGVSFTKGQAAELVAFIGRNITKELFVIHCSAGSSRSQAVGNVIFDILTTMETRPDTAGLDRQKGNGWIRRLLREAIAQNEKLCFTYPNRSNSVFND